MYGIIFNGYDPQGIPDASRAGGGYRIATHLRKQGWDIEVVDYLGYWKLEDLITLVEKRHAQHTIKWIGVSSTWIFRHPNVQGILAYIKRIYPEIKIIIGGNTNFNKDVGADYYVYGFGEYAADAILKYEFSNGKKPYGRPCFKGWAIDALHFYPAWPLEDYTLEYEERDFLVETDVVALEIGRGCKFKCKYCNFPVLGVKEDTSMSEEIMYNHFRTLYDRWGVKTYSLSDETINDRNSKLEKMAGAVQRCEFKPDFNAFTRLDLFKSHPEQIELMAGARIWGQFYGVETFNHRTGKVIGKGLHPDKNKELMLDVRKYMLEHVGVYRGTASFISGLPHETPEDLKAGHEWLSANWADEHWMVWVLSIPEEENFRLSAFGEDFSKYGYQRMTEEEIDDYAQRTGWINDNDRQGLSMLNQVIWKNEQGNYFTFHQLAERHDTNTGITESRCGNFEVFSKLSLGVSVEEALKLGTRVDQEYYQTLSNIKVNAYIQKKLAC
jgi:hypothetical protein